MQTNQPNPATTGVCPVCGAKEGKKCITIFDEVAPDEACNNSRFVAHQARIDAAKEPPKTKSAFSKELGGHFDKRGERETRMSSIDPFINRLEHKRANNLELSTSEIENVVHFLLLKVKHLEAQLEDAAKEKGEK